MTSDTERCPKCRHRYVATDPDEAEVLGLPPRMCKCDVAQHIETLRGTGWVPLEPWLSKLCTKLNVPRKHSVATYETPPVGKGVARPSTLGFGVYIPEWAWFILQGDERAVSLLGPLVERLKADAEKAAVVVSIGRMGGVNAVKDYVFAGLHVRNLDHAPCDLPDDTLTGDERKARFWERR